MTSIAGITDAGAFVRETVRAALAVRETPPPDVWLDRHRGAGGAFRWSIRTTPYLRGVLRALADPRVREVVVLKSAGVGFTEAIVGYHLYAAVELGLSSIMFAPTKDKVGKLVKNKVTPAILATPAALAALRGNVKDIQASAVTFKGAEIGFAWTQSAAGKKSEHVPLVSSDEHDEAPEGTRDQQQSRTQTYEHRTNLYGGTPNNAGDETDELFGLSDQRRYCVPCPITGRYFELWDFPLVRWEGGLRADPDGVESKAWVQSPFTPEGYTHDDPRARAYRIHNHDKAWMLANGVWVRAGETVESDGSILETRLQRAPADNARADRGASSLSELDPALLRVRTPGGRRRLPDPEPTDAERRLIERSGVRIVGEPERPDARLVGFRLNALASPFNTFGYVARGFVEAKGSPSPHWYRERLAQPWQPASDKLGLAYLRKRCVSVAEGGYTRGTAPDPVRFVVAAVDTQKDHVWASWWGFSADGLDCWYLDHERIEAPDGNDLAEIETRVPGATFARRGGAERLGVSVTAVDYGHRSEEVERFVGRLLANRRLAVSVKGDISADRYREAREGMTKNGGLLLQLPVNRIKDQLAGMIAGPAVWNPSAEGQRGSNFYLPADAPDELLEHLSSEERARPNASTRPSARASQRFAVWTPRRGRSDNHLWDDLVYAVGVLDWVGVDALVGAAAQPAAHPAADSAPRPAARPAPLVRRLRRFED
jgi:phage terminase large subunit GpA-like protein